MCPDKHRVLREEFPYRIMVSVGDAFNEFCGMNFLFPVEEFRATLTQSYWKTDTHWDLFGQLEFINIALQHLSFSKHDIEIVLNEIPAQAVLNERFCGDLGSKVNPNEF